MGALADWSPPEEDKNFYDNVVRTIEDFYPDDWKTWVVNDISFEDLFGGNEAPSDLECRLRFALPTVNLAKAHSPENNLSERRYKRFKRTMLKWPLGRALIYAPLTLMSKVHPVRAYNKFLDTVNMIKVYLVSRHEASKALRSETADDEVASISSRVSKRSHSPDPPANSKEPKLSEFFEKQNIMMEKLCRMIQATNENVGIMLNREETPTVRSVDESTISSDPEVDVDTNEDSWVAPPIVEHQDETIEPEQEEYLEDFAPGTKETEAKVTKADEAFVKQGIQCQRLNTEGWMNIRYADVQKQFQATPAFTALKVNSNLATVTPSWQLVSVLEKMDLCLGAITHGLLQQRQSFQEIYQSATPEVKSYISKNFLAAESSFRKTSDSLLQYACGKRAEVIQQRRGIYKPANKTLNELLHAIPPSENHLFKEPQLSELVKEQGGVSKLFPGKFRKTTTASSNTSRAAMPIRRPATTNAIATSETRERPQTTNNYRNSSRRPDKTRFQSKRAPAKQNKNNKKF